MTARHSPPQRHSGPLLALAGLMLASAACDVFYKDPFERVVHPKCEHRLEVAGEVAGERVASDGYTQDTTWFVYAYDDWALDAIGREGMARIGLDADSQEDVERYRYWTNAFDLRVLETERLGPGILPPIGHDLGIYFYDLERHDVQPGEEVQVFDLSSIEALRAAGDRAALGDEVRKLVDEMRDNEQPDVIVAFSSDRSQEMLPSKLFINLLSPTTRFASSGTARYFELWASSGKYLRTVRHPVRTVSAVSVEAQVTFGEDEVSIVDRCQALTVVDVRD